MFWEVDVVEVMLACEEVTIVELGTVGSEGIFGTEDDATACEGVPD